MLLLPSFGDVLIYTAFKINQDRIIKTICVQRKFATNTCQGHCALKKTLKNFDENERKMNSILKEKIELIYIQSFFENTVSFAFDFYSKRIKDFQIDEKPISISTSLFRPPAYFI